MAPEIVQGPNLKKVIYPFPFGSKNISLDSFSNTLNFNHTIHFPGKLTEFQHFNAQKSCVLYQHFEKVPTMGGGCPFHTLPLGVNRNGPPPTHCIAILYIGS